MIHTKTQKIYTVGMGNEIIARGGALELDIDEVVVDLDDLRRPMMVSGLYPSDVAAFLDFSPVNRLGKPKLRHAETIGFLVTQSHAGDGIIVPGDLVEADPRQWLSPELAAKLASLAFDEVEQFGIGSLHAYVQDRVPN
ncbi:MAG TPA: hypothetical protein VGE30_02445 [Candidatus Saccharimonadales bacterium]